MHSPARKRVVSMRWLLLLIAFVLPAQALAQGDPLGHSDRTASLYRDVLRLDAEGEPLVPLSVLGAQDKVEISAAGGLRILGTGDGQVEFRVQGSVDVQAQDPKPAVLQHYVVLAHAPDWDFDVLRQKRALWKERGLAIKTVTSGATYSIKGRAFDTRRTLLCLDAIFADAAAAEATAQGLEQQFGEDLQTHAMVGQPPSAALLAKGNNGEVRAADVLWFEANGKGMLHVVGVRKGQRVERELPGRVYVVPSNVHGLEVVSEAALEQILEGVVASEIFHSAPEATLRAQAVAARTDMLAKVGTRHATDPFAICSDVHCQAYTGAGKVSARIAQAVQDTRGLVMVNSEGRLIDAYYHAVSGGHTENNELVWPGRPQEALRGVTDLVGNAQNPLAAGATEEAVAALLAGKDESWAAASGLNGEACRWRTEKSAADIRDTAQLAKSVKEIRVTQRGVSGRAIEVELTLSDGRKKKLAGELHIRKTLGGSAGPKGLRSSLFLVKPGPLGADGVPQSWIFTGAGFGHGVGMDQTGAFGRAKAGQNFRQILQAYYKNVKIEKVY